MHEEHTSETGIDFVIVSYLFMFFDYFDLFILNIYICIYFVFNIRFHCLTPVAGLNLLEEKVPILGTFSQNSESLELFQIMSK